MGENICFPSWKLADAVLDALLREFGVHAWADEGDVYVTFLPKESVYAVPEEDRERFAKIHNAFAVWIHAEAKTSSIMEQHLGRCASLETMHSLETHIQFAIRQYECEHKIDIKSIFAACFGLGPLGVLPKELTVLLEGMAGIEMGGCHEASH